MGGWKPFCITCCKRATPPTREASLRRRCRDRAQDHRTGPGRAGADALPGRPDAIIGGFSYQGREASLTVIAARSRGIHAAFGFRDSRCNDMGLFYSFVRQWQSRAYSTKSDLIGVSPTTQIMARPEIRSIAKIKECGARAGAIRDIFTSVNMSRPARDRACRFSHRRAKGDLRGYGKDILCR